MAYGFKLWTGPTGDIPVDITTYACGTNIETTELPNNLNTTKTYPLNGLTEIAAFGLRKLDPTPPEEFNAFGYPYIFNYVFAQGLQLTHQGVDTVTVSAGTWSSNVGCYLIILGD